MASASRTPTPAQPEQTRNWLELPPEVMATILHRVGAIDILANVQMVCTTWRRICKDSAMWRVIDMHNLGDLWDMEHDLEKMCKHAVDRSEGQLIDINIEYFGTDELLQYIANRSSQLSRLRLVCCHNVSSEGLSEAVKRLPLLEELHLYYTSIAKESIEAVGRCCPLLKSFKLNNQGSRRPHIDCDEEALAIARNMPALCHLQLFGNKMTNDGLQAILDGCPHLESLDLRQCFNVTLTGNLGRRCSEQIRDMRHPNDSTEDYGFDAEIHDCESCDEEYPSGFSDIDFLSDDDEYYEFSGASNGFSDYEELFFD
ncbi:unnamed protein product [Ilex paraguariensis]|uniref:F-box domain-containing protein n=1 Tax=Ilex paraguariensis TaxID=185542 RepID=A0ABC8RDN7_9AQUA